MFDDPKFWEVIGAIVIFIGVAPVILAIGFVARVVYGGLKDQALHQRVLTQVEDPAFGIIRRVGKGRWEGNVKFVPTGRNTTIWIESRASGPTDNQQRFWKEIEVGYHDAFTEIENALNQFFRKEWHSEAPAFQLLSIEIPSDCRSTPWTAHYTAATDQDGDMGYFVEILNWTVVGVDAVD